MDSETAAFSVIERSSEDPGYPAKNLSSGTKNGKGWLSASVGSSTEFIVVQLEKPVVIQLIMVSNNFSGLLEVVGTRSATKSEQITNGETPSIIWETLVAKSSLMTPVDSRTGKNGNAERELSVRPVCAGVIWEKLKFICQQPFNKEIPYGLRAIDIQGVLASVTSNAASAEIVLKKRAKDDSIRPGSLFVSSGQLPQSAPIAAAPTNLTDGSPSSSTSNHEVILPEPLESQPAQVPPDITSEEDAEKPRSTTKNGSKKLKKHNRKPKGQQRKAASKGDSDSDFDESKPSTSKGKPQKKSSAMKKKTKEDSDSGESKPSTSRGKPQKKSSLMRKKTKDDSDSDAEDPTPKSRGRPKKNGHSSKDKAKSKGTKRKKETDSDQEEEDVPVGKKSGPPKKGAKSLKDIMTGCILAFSGWQNPFRAELRDKALEMGAKYKPDWSSECTHLVCAYPNTPKFNQVRASGGRIVKKEWIEECFEQKRMLPWRTFTLKPKTDPSSRDAEEDDELEDAKYNEESDWEPEKGASDSGSDREEEDDSDVSEVMSEELESDASLPEDDENDEEIAETDEDLEESELPLTPPQSKTKPKPKKRRKGGVRFDESDTEDEEELHLTDSSEADIPEKDFVPRKRPLFRSMNFFLYGDFPDAERNKLTKCIKELAGQVKDYNDETISHCITTAPWCQEFEEALKENPALMIVKPDWIYQCADTMNLLDARKFKPVKSA